MSVNNDLVMERWKYHVSYGRPMTGRQGRVLSTNGNNILSHGDTLYSYGTHFVLAQANRDARGNLVCLLLNGDRYSVTTSKHQSWTRGVCGRLSNELGVPTIIVPFTALRAAGVDPDDVEPIHVRADRTITHRHSSKARPGPLCERDCPDGRTVVGSRWLHHATRDTETGIAYERDESHRWRIWPPEPTSPDDFTEYVGEEPPFPQEPSVLKDRDGWSAWRERYCSANMQVPTHRPLRVPDPDKCYVGRSNWLTAEFDGETWRWETSQHLLGDSLFRARVREWVTVRPTPEQRTIFDEWREFVRECDDVRAQIGDIKAQRVVGGFQYRRGLPRRFESAPRDYRRMFRDEWSIDALDDKLSALADRTGALRTALMTAMGDHSWRERGGRLHIERRRTRKPFFLSSFDYQEAQPLYFLCELPHGARPETVEDAIDALKPPEVVAAEARGLKVTRQGDLFAIPTRLTKRQIRRLRNARHDFEKRLRVLGTNHSVTEGVIARGGAVLGRGIMRHEPDGWRDPDHARQRMGDGKAWHLLVRNTVPRH